MEEAVAEFTRLLARVALMEQLLRLLYKERSLTKGDTPEDALAFAEEIKQLFEARMPGVEGAFMTGVIDRFFNNVVSDIHRATGNPGEPQPPQT